MSSPSTPVNPAYVNQGDTQCGMSLPWESIRQPGAYVCQWDGHLVRVPADGKWGNLPTLSMVGAEPLYVTMISDNPFVTITKARLLASNHDLPVNF